jgi:TldD protein
MSEIAATDPLVLARELILAPSGLDDQRLDRVFGEVLSHSVDFADLYFQLTHQESWSLEDGIVKDGSASIDQGVGVRALAGEKTGFAYSDEILLPALTEASRAARAIALHGGERRVSAWRAQAGHQLYLPADPAAALATPEKVAWLERVDREARRIDPRVVHVNASAVALHEVVLIATSEGLLAADVRPLVRFNVTVLVEQGGRREQGYAGCGGRYSLAELVANERPLLLAREAVRQALVNLEAIPAPAGTMTVVLGPGWPGILLHEAIGHGLEGDFNRKGTSAFANRIGERVAAAECTVVDDGTLSRRRGSLNIDDEGTPTQCTTLIENGVLRGYMQDRLNARLMGAAPTGNGRHLRGQFWRRTGGHHFRQVRVLGQRGLRHRERPPRRTPEGRDTDRQRSGRADARFHGGQRLKARRWRGNLRQGRTERAGRRRSADAAHRCAHRRRDRLRRSRSRCRGALSAR